MSKGGGKKERKAKERGGETGTHVALCEGVGVCARHTIVVIILAIA